MVNASSGVRRSQAVRRAETRAALLDATIKVLVRDGYSRLTTNEIVKVAGVSRGAQSHYFVSKADLLVQALDHLKQKLIDELEQSTEPVAVEGVVAIEQLLDLLWDFHRGPLFTAAIELWVAGRTDREIRMHLRRFDREFRASAQLMTARFFPKYILAEGFPGFLVTALSAMRGLAMLRFTASDEAVDRVWHEVRADLVGSFERLKGRKQAKG